MKTPRILIALSVVILPVTLEAGAAPADERFGITFQAVVNPAEGNPRTECELSASAASKGSQWRVAFARVRRHGDAAWNAVGSDIECGESIENTMPDESPGVHYLAADVSAAVSFNPSRLIPERVIRMDVTLTNRMLSEFAVNGEPVYRETSRERSFFFLNGGSATFPLFVSKGKEEEVFGIREIFIELTVTIEEAEPEDSYGALTVSSGNEGGEILLDGGPAGAVSAGAETTLRNVMAGMHEVGLRGASGNETRKAARVLPNRRVLVDLGNPDPARDVTPFRLVPLGRNTHGYEEYRRGIDGAVVVMIPAGEFLMGNREAERTPLEHMVYVSEFLMDRTGVTWGQYKIYAEATGVPLPAQEPYWGIHDDHPAVYVTWEDAKNYCHWAGARLPTEAEREKAARGTDRRKFPWGDEEPDLQRAVFRRSWGKEATAAVGTHPTGASPYGLLDMGGNVWEWCSDWYDGGYSEVSPYRDPKGPLSGRAHVVRGGSWDSRPDVLSASCRSWGHLGYREGDFGFRCAMNAAE